MSKITVTDLANLQNQTTAVNAINNNNAAITTAFDNTLSRDGTSPNTMGSNLDMNSYHILNLPAPVTNYEPLRVIDADTLNGGGSITVSSLPVGGTTGQALTKNSATNFDAGWSTITGSSSYTAPFTGSVNRTLNSKLSDLVSVMDFGASNTGAESTAAFNAAFTNASAIVIPPGTYALSGDVQIPSNRFIWVQKGATITNTGGRFTGYVPGGGNIEFRIDGVMAFLATADGASKNGTNGWDTATGPPFNRGCIEIGGDRVGSNANNIYIHGCGEVYSDYVWSGVPSSFFNLNFQLNRKGIALFNVSNARIEGLYVHNMYGEAVYCQSTTSNNNVQFSRNRVVNSAFDALNFNCIGSALGWVMSDNYVENAWVGVEASTGHIKNNSITSTRAGINTGGGSGTGDQIIQGNRIYNCVDAGITISFAGPCERFLICDNSIYTVGTWGISINNIAEVTVVNNSIYLWANVSAGVGIQIFSAVANGYVNGNIIHTPGAFSTGTVINGGLSVTVGTNIIT